MNDGQAIFDHVVSRVQCGQFRIRSKSGEVEVSCPRCLGKYKFSVGAGTGYYGCFTCTLKGVIRREIKDNPSKWSVVRRAAGASGEVSGGQERRAGTGSRDISLPLRAIGGDTTSVPGVERPAMVSPGLIERAYNYCLSRGMTAGQISKYRVSVLPLQERVYFPYWEDNNLTFWMGRAIREDEEPKTLELGTGHDKPLFGSHVESWDGSSPLMLVEGVFDHFATPNSYALMGSFISSKQIRGIKEKNPPWVALILDPDAIGKAHSYSRSLWRAGIKNRVVRWANTSNDPGKLAYEVMSGVVEELSRLPVPSRPEELRVRV